MIKLSKITAGSIQEAPRRSTPRKMAPVRANVKSFENLSASTHIQENREHGLRSVVLFPKTSDSIILPHTQAQTHDVKSAAAVSIMELRLRDDKKKNVNVRSESIGTLTNLLARKGSVISKLRSRSGDVKPESLSISHHGSRGSFIANNNESRVSVGNNIVASSAFFNGRSNESIYQSMSTSDLKVKPSELQEKIAQSISLGNKILRDPVGNPKIASKAKSCLQQFQYLLEKAYSKFILFPDTEKESVDTLLGIQTQVVGFIKETQKFLSDYVTEKLNMEKLLREKKEELHKQLVLNDEIRNENVSAVNDKANLKKLESLLRAAKEHAFQSENIWAVEKQQLKAEIENLHLEVKKVQAQEYIVELEKKYDLMHEVFHNQVKRLNEDIEKKDNEITKLEALLNRAINTAKEQKEELDDLRWKFRTMSSEHKEIKTKHDEYFTLYNKYREIAQMSKEDLQQTTLNSLKFADAARQAEFRYFRMQNKFDLTRKEQADYAGFSLEEIAHDTQMLTEVKQIFQNIKYPAVTLKTQSIKEKNPNLSLPPQQADSSLLEKYSLFRPTFYSLINQKELAEADKPAPDPADVTTVISKEFISIIRGIFDSKYHEIIYYDHHRQYSPFVDFVYSWMNSFHICPIKKRIHTITALDNISVDKRRLEFYQFLMNPYVSKLWDVKAFKDFLEEKYSSDELFFYLQCRQVLFKGPQLETLAAGLNVIHWIEFERIETALKTILAKLNQKEVEHLKAKLKSRGRVHNKKVFIDSAFFFKVLLDFYRHEKIKKFELIREDFMHMAKVELKKKPQVHFNEFKQYVQVNFPFLSDMEKARVYRECWCVGGGIVDADSYFVVANESNLFLQGLKLLVFNSQLPVVESIEAGPTPPVVNKSVFLKTLEFKYHGITESLAKCQYFVEGFGVEEILSNLSFKEKELLNAFSSPAGDDADKGFYTVFMDFLNLMLKARNQYIFSHKYIKGCENDLIDNDAFALKSMMEPLKKYENLEKLEWNEKTKYALKIQALFKRKKSNWYAMMGSAIAKAKKSQPNKNSNIVVVDKYVENGVVDLL